MTLWADRFDWNEGVITRLRELWAQLDKSTAEIGRALGTSKNSVVGKAHRLDLPGRPSPIIQNGARRTYMPRKSREIPALPSLPSTIFVDAAPPPKLPPQPSVPVIQMTDWIEDCTVAEKPNRPPLPPGRAYPDPMRRRNACQWPFGEPGAAGFCFCAAGVERGKPYCGEHVFVSQHGTEAWVRKCTG